jgi:hypothetical protein
MTIDFTIPPLSEEMQQQIAEESDLNEAKQALKNAAQWVERLVESGCTDAELTGSEVRLRVAMKMYMQAKREQRQ